MNSDMAKTETRKLFAFFGADLERKGQEFLQQAYGEGYTLLALDASAIGMAATAKAPYTLIDDWLDSEAMFQAKQQAAKCERRWFEAARDEFSSDGICWPEFDREAMYWFWLDVTLASTFAEAFRARGGQDLRFFQHAVRRPALYYYRSDVCSALWKADLAGKAKAFELPRKSLRKPLRKPFWNRALRFSWSKVRKIARLTTRRRNTLAIAHPSVLAGKVVLAFNPGEFHRFTPIIQQLSESFPRNVAAVILSPSQATANEIAAKWSIPVVCGPSPAPVDPGLQEKFLRGYVKALDGAGGQPWQKPLESLQFHFEYYCKQRWPQLALSFRYWVGLWTQSRPKAVIVSSLEDGESQLPAEAARCCGIPTLSTPHGGGGARAAVVVVADYVLYSLSTQKGVYERAGVPIHRLIGCREVVVDNEYTVVSIDTHSKQNSWRLLALTNPTCWPDHLAPRISPGAQLAALRALNNPPPDIAEQLSLRIKAHPNRRWSDSELFSAIGGGIAECVLPLNSELLSVLERTDLVVALNFLGSALLHALRTHKPVIFFWTDPLIGRVEPHVHADLFLPAGTLVRNPEEFWDLVRRFFTDPEVAEQMGLKAVEFCRNNLDDSNYPSIGEVVDQVLSNQMHPQFSP